MVFISLFIGMIILGILMAWFKSAGVKGAIGEGVVNIGTWLLLDKSKYHLVKNVTLPTEDGTTQIDHVIVSRYGIFVVETKNMNGAIYGTEHQSQWTQAFGRNKFRFQNPLHQNYKHTRTLADLLAVPHEVMKPIVMFIGDARLKTRDELPAHVLDRGLLPYIKSFREEILDESEVQRVLKMIEENRLTPSRQTHREHVQHVREIVAAKQQPAKATEPLAAVGQTPVCPKCGKRMVLRTATKGPNAGGKFWGCSGYPGCRGIVKTG